MDDMDMFGMDLSSATEIGSVGGASQVPWKQIFIQFARAKSNWNMLGHDYFTDGDLALMRDEFVSYIRTPFLNAPKRRREECAFPTIIQDLLANGSESDIFSLDMELETSTCLDGLQEIA
jgi:hypothetical protein